MTYVDEKVLKNDFQEYLAIKGFFELPFSFSGFIFCIWSKILFTPKMFCFDHFIAWLFLLDMICDGLATAKYHDICYQRDTCQYWWLSLLFMVQPTIIFICAILLIAIKQTKRIDHLVNYAILACFYPLMASLGIIITIINTFCARKGTNQGQSLIMLPEFLFEAIPQVKFIFDMRIVLVHQFTYL